MANRFGITCSSRTTLSRISFDNKDFCANRKKQQDHGSLILYNKEAEPIQSSHIVSSHVVGSGAKAGQIAQVPVYGNQAHYSGFTHVGVIGTV